MVFVGSLGANLQLQLNKDYQHLQTHVIREFEMLPQLIFDLVQPRTVTKQYVTLY